MGNGLITATSPTTRMTSITRQFSGLINQGSTCYLNCLIQALYHLPLFRKKIFEIQSQDKLVVALQMVFCRLEQRERNIMTTDLTAAFGWSNEQVYVQHDVHELIQILFDRIEKQLKGSSMEHFIADIFCGDLIYRSQAVDTDVKYVSDRLEKFYDLEVVVNNSRSLSESLEKLSTPERIDGVEVEISPGKTTKLNIERSLRILNLPPVLMIHPNRVTFNMETYELQTINNQWTFTSSLDLADYLVEKECLKLDKESLDKINDHPHTLRVKNQVYELHSILIHSGTTTMGHYYAFVRLDNQWVCFNDDHVSVCHEEVVSKSAFGGQNNKNSFYENERASVLFYINTSCLDEVLNEKDIVLPQNVLSQKTYTVKFYLSGLYERESGVMDSTPLYTAPLPEDYTLDDLSKAIYSAAGKDSGRFILVAIMGSKHFLVDDVEKIKKLDSESFFLVAAPDFYYYLVRTDGYMIFMSKNSLHQLNANLKEKNQLWVLDKKGKTQLADSQSFSLTNDFAYAMNLNEAEQIFKRPITNWNFKGETASLIHVPSVCNGMWEIQNFRIYLEPSISYPTLLERVKLILSLKSHENISFFRIKDMSIAFPPLAIYKEEVDQCYQIKQLFMDGSKPALYYTILPYPAKSVLSFIAIVINVGWERQPRVYLRKNIHQSISLPIALKEAVEQVKDSLPENFLKRIELLKKDETPSQVAKLYKMADASYITEVAGEEELSEKHLYVVDICTPPPQGHTAIPVFYCSSQWQTKFFGLPTTILISNTFEETGKIVLERVCKRLSIPVEANSIDVSRWIIYVETSTKKNQKLGVKDTLKSILKDEVLVRFCIDRPIIIELDGLFSPGKETENLVIGS